MRLGSRYMEVGYWGVLSLSSIGNRARVYYCTEVKLPLRQKLLETKLWCAFGLRVRLLLL